MWTLYSEVYFHLSTLKFRPFLKNLCIESKPVIALVQYKLLNVFALFKSTETFFSISYVCSPGNYQNIFGEEWRGLEIQVWLWCTFVLVWSKERVKKKFGVKIYTHQSDSLVLSSSLSDWLFSQFVVTEAKIHSGYQKI